VPDVDALPRVTPTALREIYGSCPRRVALDFDDAGFSDAVTRGRLRDAFLDAARAAHGDGDVLRFGALLPPADLEPEERAVFAHAARWYAHLYGDRVARLHLHDCDRPTERGGVRVGGWVDLTLVRPDGTKELRQLDLWRGRRPATPDPMELERVWLAVLRLRPWVSGSPLIVSWADLVDGMLYERTVDLDRELDGLRSRYEDALLGLRRRADPTRIEPGSECIRCRHLAGCPAHPGATRVRAARGDVRPGVLRVTPTTFDTWQRCRRAWWLSMLTVPSSDETGSPDHGQLVHDVLRFVHDRGTCHDAAHVEDVLASHAGSDRLRGEVQRHEQRCPSPAESLGHEVSFARFTAARPALASFLVTARLDAVWVHDGLLDARDYKTGRVATARVADDPRAWLQAWVLAPIAERRGLRLRLRYEHLGQELDEEPEPWEPDADDFAALETQLRSEVRAMRDEVDFAGVAEADVCRSCRYRSICRDSASPGEPTWPEIALPDVVRP
jgi:hypothetical protein